MLLTLSFASSQPMLGQRLDTLLRRDTAPVCQSWTPHHTDRASTQLLSLSLKEGPARCRCAALLLQATSLAPGCHAVCPGQLQQHPGCTLTGMT